MPTYIKKKITPKKKTYVKPILKAFTRSKKKRQSAVVKNSSMPIAVPNSYLAALLKPENSPIAQIPGTSDSSIPLHRRVTITVAANALGNIGFLWQPTSLNDASTATSTLFINNSVGYDGISVLGASSAVGVATNFSLTTGVAIGYRVVSASLHVRSNASTLNLQGKINFGNMPFRGVVPTATGTTLATATGVTDNFLFVPTFENLRFTGVCNLEQQQSARILWYPTFPLHKSFVEPNNNYQTGNTGAAYEENALVAVVTGVAASQLMTIDLYVNYELRPNVGSILQGMERISSSNVEAEAVIRSMLIDHEAQIAYTYDSKNSVSRTTAPLIIAQRNTQETEMQRLINSFNQPASNGFFFPRYWRNKSFVIPSVPEDTTEFHFPGCNFLGPGTHIIERINNKVIPTSRADFLAMLHDIDYLRSAGDPVQTIKADNRAIKNAGYTPLEIALSKGLQLRKFLNLKFNEYTPNQEKGQDLLNFVKTHKPYSELFQKYSVDPNQY